LTSVLEEKSDILHQEMLKYLNDGLSQDWVWDTERKMKALFMLECARFHNLYYRVKEADSLVERAADLTGVQLSETGALGKRTKYQQKDVAQFWIDLGTDNQKDVMIHIDPDLLARDIKLDDDVRLERIKFQDENRDNSKQLTGLQQSVLIARFNSKLRALPFDSLTSEEVFPYLVPLLEHPQSWSLHSKALLARSELESTTGRTVERSLAQVENIVENLRLGRNKLDRLRMVYSSLLPPVWEIERKLGKLMLSLGSTKSALDIFLRLELWEEVIVCYSMLELRHKAAEVIQTRLDLKETPRLWCMLGDATDNLDCYHTALKLSGDKNARAYRSLGMYYYNRKEFRECVPLFQKSLERSSCQPIILLRLAYSAMELEMWELAAQSYRSYCSFEMDSFEAWNNLAKCYINLRQKERAWRVLQEALRCDYDNWKVWDNLMVIATDIAVFDDVIRSYNRLLDLKQTHMDEQVLNILVRAVKENLTDREGQSSIKYKERVQKLLARLTVAMPKEPVPWRLYGSLLTSAKVDDLEYNQEQLVRGVQCYQRGFAALTGIRGWERSNDSCIQVIKLAITMVDVVMTVKGVQELQLAASMRLSIASALKLIEKGQMGVESGNFSEEMGAEVGKMRESLNALTDRITQLRAG